MKITFLGAAQTVTGSCFILETDHVRFAVDCGMHQGNAEIEKRNWDASLYDPKHLDFILITHAHIDHSGLLPKMAQEGFAGPIYTTPPTRDLLEIMLLDSAHIQEMEAEWRNKKKRRHGKKQEAPLYSEKDAEAAHRLVRAAPTDKAFEPAPGIQVTMRDAGHILGSAMLEIEYRENGQPTKLVFSGDIGRPNQLLMADPTVIKEADYLFMESTYGNRDHKNEASSREELAAAIRYSYNAGEKVIIPAFAVERTQEVLYSLHLLEREGKLPADMPVYLDSPMAIRATEVFSRYPKYLDKETRTLMDAGENPLELKNLRPTLATAESQAINSAAGPAIVISASGMANAGRIKHHLRHNLWRQGASVVFTGFQAMGTPGRRIVDGAKTIRLFGEEVSVAAKIWTIGGFSAHAGQSQLLEWLSNFTSKDMRVILVHGESSAQTVLAQRIREKFSFDVHAPAYREELILEPGRVMTPVVDEEKAAPRIDWNYLLADSQRILEELKARAVETENRPWVDQTDMRDRLMEINRAMVELISEL
ncbi:MAG: metallo-beta-lactamase family protein [Desulfovibrionales bacterium]|nr:metallo-beta-lactamase family protein [Desulfovibrionales bacterium]